MLYEECNQQITVMKTQILALEQRNSKIEGNQISGLNYQIIEQQCLEINTNLLKINQCNTMLNKLDQKLTELNIKKQISDASLKRFSASLKRLRKIELSAQDLFALDDSQAMIIANGRRNHNQN